ncbi:tumor necrosis factor ligand superfamily member 18 [Dasypus novemcinctus]|uniref:Tumor necrosis factor ligand superfamily member 18 n=1 Tax=Dasypus novemcinctus TaxID=9361 RepID=A0A0U5J7Q3_DASNO|nr:tumor necrosis factor ligand superfamily member 18 [Dasypus novemcinctus]CTQ86268.1 TPA: tumor necrosis factor ligand 2A [Dasypus novemcinctus]
MRMPLLRSIVCQHSIRRKTPPHLPTTNYHNTTKHGLLHRSPIIVNLCFPQQSFFQKISLSHVENMPLNHSSPQGAQRWSWKPWLLSSTIVILLLFCSCSVLIFTFLLLKNANEPCGAKFGPLPSKWQTTSSELTCVNKTSDWKLRILHSGVYLIYGQVAPNATYKETAPFEVRLSKNDDILQSLKDKSKVQNVGGTYELHAEDTIVLEFNSDYQVLENNTYWGILLLANPQFI